GEFQRQRSVNNRRHSHRFPSSFLHSHPLASFLHRQTGPETEKTVHKLASLLLIVLGGSYILLFLSGKGGHSHSHNQPMEKMVVAALVLVPALSPCATTLPVFLVVGNSSTVMVLAIIVLLFRYRMKNDSEF
ncbi:hypothetical protein Gotur_012172, partial [Gossypium turneri]